MTPTELLKRISGEKPARELLEKYDESRTLRLKGVSGSLLSFLVSTITSQRPGVHLLVVEDRDAASYLYNDIYNIFAAEGADPAKLFLFPTAYKRSINTMNEDPSGIVQRTAVLSAISSRAEKESLIICTYPEAVAEKVADRDRLRENTLSIGKGDTLSISFVEEVLIEYHFEKVDFVYQPGQYSVRGGIIDIFSFSDNVPYRIDFFGDTVESIRTFAVGDQLSTERRDKIEIVPNLKNPELAADRISIVEYIGAEMTVWFQNPIYALERIDQVRTKLLRDMEHPQEIDSHTTSRKSFIAESRNARWITLSGTLTERKADAEIEFDSSPQPQFNKNFELLAQDIAQSSEKGYTTYILTENYAQRERLENILSSISGTQAGYGEVSLTIHEGFVDHNLKLAIYTDHQIFDRFQRYKVHGELDRSDTMTIQELNSLQIGDYVVHIDHGVGKFGGLARSNEGGVNKEYIKLVYRDNDVLFVNVHALHRISKYKDKDAPQPKIYKLGSGAWQRLKASAKSKVKDIARELITLYANRKASSGFVFSPDSYLQQELEASFIYEDTPDQHTTTSAVKNDMESEVPMDRLVCGDVGFGKTEIAIRAAFKAATDGKQVAVLVPTTILSLQHYRTFSRRLKDFPVTIENFSRARSTKESSDILRRLAEGKVDIIIGTHKLLGKNVHFHDLGLLVIDEEQKFGVGNKEKLRELKANVDTLTLTATPIPRTLQFSLMGARDMSIINTPPPNRQPVATEVLVFDEDIVAEAIQYELARGGQVFFLHNRVQTIDRIADTIRKIVPRARVAVGHGQMAPAELEKVMMDFIYGEYDILVATTIIESGIDIPNANTIIINNAHMFGLSDLHQLRGRVGRMNRKAFCYLLIPSNEAITGDAQRRLRAIEEFSDLGSGFNIAMQDLDIRGAGNILGAQQSGFITDIGFETYQKILNEAVFELRAERGLEPDEPVMDCVIETDTAAHLPDNYVSSTAEKIRLYRLLDGITTPESLDVFIDKLRDRFGEPPPEAMELFEVVLLRQTAALLSLEKIVVRKGIATLYFAADPQSKFFNSEKFSTIMKHILENPGRFRVNEGNNKLALKVNNLKSLTELRSILENLVS